MMRGLYGYFDATVRRRVAGVSFLLLLTNAAAWAWALVAFHAFPIQLGTAVLAYVLGLRHAFDADHIAAIDNVTRRLMADGRRPVAVGLFFSLGHSTVVVALSIVVALATGGFQGRFQALRSVGSVVGTVVSASFLFAIALANLAVLTALFRSFRELRSCGRFVEAEFEAQIARRGFLARLFRPFINVIGRSWQMYPLGLMFGLGFDTATEVGLLGIAATQASSGLPVWSILVFPALFTAGMTLADTMEGILMLGAYDWASVSPIRKLYYNLTITLLSVVVALLVGGIETLGLIADQFGYDGPAWRIVRGLNDDFGTLGLLIVGLFLVSWTVSYLLYRSGRYDETNVSV